MLSPRAELGPENRPSPTHPVSCPPPSALQGSCSPGHVHDTGLKAPRLPRLWAPRCGGSSWLRSARPPPRLPSRGPPPPPGACRCRPGPSCLWAEAPGPEEGGGPGGGAMCPPRPQRAQAAGLQSLWGSLGGCRAAWSGPLRVSLPLPRTALLLHPPALPGVSGQRFGQNRPGAGGLCLVLRPPAHPLSPVRPEGEHRTPTSRRDPSEKAAAQTGSRPGPGAWARGPPQGTRSLTPPPRRPRDTKAALAPRAHLRTQRSAGLPLQTAARRGSGRRA